MITELGRAGVTGHLARAAAILGAADHSVPGALTIAPCTAAFAKGHQTSVTDLLHL
jgi:hypothetical protein